MRRLVSGFERGQILDEIINGDGVRSVARKHGIPVSLVRCLVKPTDNEMLESNRLMLRMAREVKKQAGLRDLGISENDLAELIFGSLYKSFGANGWVKVPPAEWWGNGDDK